MQEEITYAYAGPIIKAEKQEDGSVRVFGRAASDDLDLDGQIADPEWLKGAMPRWMQWGNMREQHTMVAAGVGIELTQDGDNAWNLLSEAVDPNVAAKLLKGVYKGYSIGVKNGRVVKDAQAPGGRIVGGEIVEVSYVDRPSNPTTLTSIMKSAGGTLWPVDEDGNALEDAERLEGFGVPEEAEEEQPAEELDADEADEGDGEQLELFDLEHMGKAAAPAYSVGDYRRGLRLVDAHLADGFPANWGTALLVKAAGGTVDESADIAGAWKAIEQICDLAIHELTELRDSHRREEVNDVKTLLGAIYALECFLDAESCQHGSDYNSGLGDDEEAEGSDVPPELGGVGGSMTNVTPPTDDSTIYKRAFSAKERASAADSGAAMADGSFPIKNSEDLGNAIHLAGNAKDPAAARAHIKTRAAALGLSDRIPDTWKAASVDGQDPAILDHAEIVKTVTAEVTKAHKAEVDSLREQVARLHDVLSKTPAPGGPVVKAATATRPTPASVGALDEAASIRALASATSDPDAHRALSAYAEKLAKGV